MASLNILVEASGSLVCGYLIKAIQQAGHRAIASDVEPECAGRYLADDFIAMPHASDKDLWGRVESELASHRVHLVIPSFDETLTGWAERKADFGQKGIHVCLSDTHVLRIFSDKWLAYGFFDAHGIPTPKTSLQQDYPLVKPRVGRGAVGVKVTHEPVAMEGRLSQELIAGTEYTVDVLCACDGAPVYIVPRRRLGVREGKSTGGVVEYQDGIVKVVQKLCSSIRFTGPINVQCFIQNDGSVVVIEVNPRVAGGMALGFAATENWIPLMVGMMCDGAKPTPGPVNYGMRMFRYYADLFIPAN